MMRESKSSKTTVKIKGNNSGTKYNKTMHFWGIIFGKDPLMILLISKFWKEKEKKKSLNKKSKESKTTNNS